MKQLVVVGLVFAALSLTACGALAPAAPATPTTILSPVPTEVPPTLVATATPVVKSTPPPAASPTLGKPVDVLANAFRGLAGVKTFRAKLVMSGLPKVGTQEMNLDVVLPDRFHVTSQQLEMILVGKTVYMKVANKWQKVATTQFDLSLADPGKLEKDLQSATGTKVMGTDDLNGTPAFVYQFTTSVKGPPAQTHTYKVWIGAKDGLPRQMEVDVNTGAKTTISFFDYNTPITINAPI